MIRAFGTGVLVTLVVAFPLNLFVRLVPVVRYLGFPLAALAPSLLVLGVRYSSARPVVWTGEEVAAMAGSVSTAVVLIVVWWRIWVRSDRPSRRDVGL